MTIQIGIPPWWAKMGGGGNGLEAHNHSSPAQGGVLPLTSIVDHDKPAHDALGINADLVDGLHLPNTVINLLSNHDKAIHDALGINADKVDGIDLPNTIAIILSNHNKTVHDALNINADTVDGKHLPNTIVNVLSNHTKAVHEALGLIAGDVPSCRVNRAGMGDQSVPHDTWTRIMLKNNGTYCWDNKSNWNNTLSQFLVSEAGRYLVLYNTEFEEMGKCGGTGYNERTGAKILLNGDYMKGQFGGRMLPINVDPALIGTHIVLSGCVLNCAVDDIIHVEVFHFNQDTSSKMVTGDEGFHSLWIQKMID